MVKKNTKKKKTRGIPADRRIENRLVRAVSSRGQATHNRLWFRAEPVVRAMLGEPSVSSSASLLDIYADALDSFEDLEEIKRVSHRMFEANSTNSRIKLAAMLQRTIGVSFDDSATKAANKEAITQAVSFSVNRIKTINVEHFAAFKDTITQGVLEGKSVASLRELVTDAGGFDYPKWKVDRIVIDQYLTVHAEIQRNRLMSAGVTHYFWRTVSDARVRPSHASNANKRFAWDNPPEETGHPGTDVRCRCTADPDLSIVGDSLNL